MRPEHICNSCLGLRLALPAISGNDSSNQCLSIERYVSSGLGRGSAIAPLPVLGERRSGTPEG